MITMPKQTVNHRRAEPAQETKPLRESAHSATTAECPFLAAGQSFIPPVHLCTMTYGTTVVAMPSPPNPKEFGGRGSLSEVSCLEIDFDDFFVG